MNMVPVSSSNLVAVGYSNGTLRIQFRNGLYDFLNVPENVHRGLMNSHSHGKYFAAYIKDKYNKQKIE